MYVVMGIGMIIVAFLVFLSSGPRSVGGYVLAAMGITFLVMAVGAARSAAQYSRFAQTTSGIRQENEHTH
jgi:hypothetical protein